MTTLWTNKNILLIISGGIAAYKSLELIRLIKKQGGNVRCILTEGGQKFITPMAVSALTGDHTYTDLWSLKDESEMGHIRLSREADLILVAPASANLLAKMTHGMADDLASTCLLATNKPVFVAPAMNPMMWQNAATQDNVATLKSRNIQIIGPGQGDTACGELGTGRMSEPTEIMISLEGYFKFPSKPLKGYKALVTSGPTYEPLDPVRFIGNRSSGKQGHAIAEALAQAGAEVTLVTGPTAEPNPLGVTTHHIETAEEMLAACKQATPCDIAICAAAVSDWRASKPAQTKTKKSKSKSTPNFDLAENPDILATLSKPGKNRPKLVIGFAAETPDKKSLEDLAKEKMKRKACDWILANDVSDGKIFGKETNQISLVTKSATTQWDNMSKTDVAYKLVLECTKELSSKRVTNLKSKTA